MDYVIRSILIAVVSATSVGNYITKTFEDGTNTGDFNHLVMDSQTGKLYLGAVNRLYLLTETLTKEKSIDTGQEWDSPKCPPVGDCICDVGSESDCEMYRRKPMDSISKALEIDYTDATLITCVNLFQGMCQKLHLEDLTPLDPPIKASFIVPNDWDSPAVAFIAPGVPDSTQNNVMYVAATRSTIGLDIYNDLIPAAASRNLQNFKIAYEDIVSASKKEVEHQLRGQFRVQYITGFSSGGFSYFVTVQRDSVNMNTNYSTKIVRVCQNDAKYYSYTEVPLKCSFLGADYNILQVAYVTHPGGELARDLGIAHLPPFTDSEHVLFAVFSKSEQWSPEPVADSVLCIYPMGDSVSKVFTKTIQDCFNGVGNTGPAHIGPISSCVPTGIQIDDNYCGTYELNTPISGTTPVSARALLRFEGTLVTSLAVTHIHDYTVAFVGTDTGTLKKVVIESAQSAMEYEDITVERGSAIQKDVYFDQTGEHIYVMSARRLSMIKVQDCGRYHTCGDCLGAKDPYCGWCYLENKCSMKSSCKDSEQLQGWLPYRGDQCTRILHVVPDQVQIKADTASKLVLTIQNLPALTTGDYQCAFSSLGTTRTTSALVSEHTSGDSSQIQCETPIHNLLPRIPTGKDHIVMQLSVRMNGHDFVSQNLTFFSCGLHQSCSSCTDSEFPCTWCVKNHKCTDNQENCLRDVLINGRNVQGDTDRPGPLHCPRIESSSTEILVPSGMTKEVSVKVLNLQDFQEDFKCNFNIDGGREVNASRTQGKDFITCAPVSFEYGGQAPHRNVLFNITWGAPVARPLDNPDTIRVKVYKCATMADDCGSCLTMEPKFSCGWCDGHCSIQQQCTASSWLDHTQICPHPKILRFTPTSGPREGGTKVTIEGNSLGKVFDDIKDGVAVAGVPCIVDQEWYEPAKRLVCTTGSVANTTSGLVQVVVNNRFRGESRDGYSYVHPRIHDFFPKKGPQSGGTRVTITGQHMNTGTNIEASIGDLPCQIISTLQNQVVCISSFAVEPKIDYLVMRFDMATILHNRNHFQYTQNPQISSVSPQWGILSGGLKIKIRGSYLSSVQEPQMHVMLDGYEYRGDCEVWTDSEMSCLSPSLSDAVLHLPFSTSYGFLMDNVTELQNFTAFNDMHPVFKIFQDPTFELFETGTKHFRPESVYLTLNGEHLNLTLTKTDVTVMVGSAPCSVTSIADWQLTCRPPSRYTEGVGHHPTVTVIVGHSSVGFNVTLGNLCYIGPGVFAHHCTCCFTSTRNSTGLTLIEGLALGIGIAATCISIIVVMAVMIYKLFQKEKRQVNRHELDVQIDENATSMPYVTPSYLELIDDIHESTCHVHDLVNNIQDPKLKATVKELLFPDTRLHVGKLIGKGNFGCVYRGQLYDENGCNAQDVAVKTLQGHLFDQSTVESFLEEGVIMKNFDHPHVLRLLGVCIERGKLPMVVLPFMAGGDLRTYIRDETKEVSLHQLLAMAQQVAKGMAYLASCNFVHRDLAARNCVINEEGVVMVADFGLSRDMYDKDYYSTKDHTRKMPIKWMALESLQQYIFNIKTDVWSFGVLMWELVTRGVMPYPDVGVFDVQSYLAEGRRMRQPKYCPDYAYKIMLDCWLEDPELRPLFDDLVKALGKLLNASKEDQGLLVESSDGYLQPKSNENKDGSPSSFVMKTSDHDPSLEPNIELSEDIQSSPVAESSSHSDDLEPRANAN